jgi:hypothetical protein
MARKKQTKRLPDKMQEQEKQEFKPEQLQLFVAFRDIWQAPLS